MRLDDPELVRREYADERGLHARASVYGGAYGGPDAAEVAFAAVRGAAPARVLEVGCGPGDFVQRVARELRARVVALDLPPREDARCVASSVAHKELAGEVPRFGGASEATRIAAVFAADT